MVLRGVNGSAIFPMNLELLQRIQSRTQAGLVAAGSVLVQHAFLDCLVESGNSPAIRLFGGGLVALGQRRTHVAES